MGFMGFSEEGHSFLEPFRPVKFLQITKYWVPQDFSFLLPDSTMTWSEVLGTFLILTGVWAMAGTIACKVLLDVEKDATALLKHPASEGKQARRDVNLGNYLSKVQCADSSRLMPVIISWWRKVILLPTTIPTTIRNQVILHHGVNEVILSPHHRSFPPLLGHISGGSLCFKQLLFLLFKC